MRIWERRDLIRRIWKLFDAKGEKDVRAKVEELERDN